MFRIEKTGFGFRLTFTDVMTAAEMREWLERSKHVLSDVEGGFGVLVDMRELEPLGNDAKAIMVKTQHLYRKQGMTRSAVVVSNSTLMTQFRLLARSSGIHVDEHYLNAVETPDWEEKALAWIEQGVVPEP